MSLIWNLFVMLSCGWGVVSSAVVVPDYQQSCNNREAAILAHSALELADAVPVSKAFFSRKDPIRTILIGLIELEQKHIRLASFVITDEMIAEALIRASQRGVRVDIVVCHTGVTDDTLYRRMGQIEALQNAGIMLYVYRAAPKGSGPQIMHHKFILLGDVAGRSLIGTGSFNLTHAASFKNCESFSFFENEMIIEAFAQEFNWLISVSTPYSELETEA